MNTSYFCPICAKELRHIQRYPKYVCESCSNRARSRDGRPLKFFNISLSGGFTAQYADTGEVYESHECFIDDVPCYADEARFGGIVIQVLK